MKLFGVFILSISLSVSRAEVRSHIDWTKKSTDLKFDDNQVPHFIIKEKPMKQQPESFEIYILENNNRLVETL